MIEYATVLIVALLSRPIAAAAAAAAVVCTCSDAILSVLSQRVIVAVGNARRSSDTRITLHLSVCAEEGGGRERAEGEREQSEDEVM